MMVLLFHAVQETSFFAPQAQAKIETLRHGGSGMLDD
jgi:hypothetical protein